MITSHPKHLFILGLFIISSLTFSCKSDKVEVAIPTVTSIEKAKKLKLGTEVTVIGTVTVASGTFASSRPYGYAVQDSTAGLYVIDSIAPMQGAFSVGDRAIITGTTEMDNGLFCLKEVVATKAGKGSTITPLVVKTGQVNESTEGLIISTSGTIDSLFNDPPYGYKIFINDGSGLLDIYVNTSTYLLGDTLQWQISDYLSATGFSSQYDKKYECDPRTGADIRVVDPVE